MNYIYRFILAKSLAIAILLILVSGILFTGCVYAASDTSSELPSPIQITEGWEYRIGDSPMDKDGLPQWIYTSSSDWKPFKYPDPPEYIKGHNIIWLRVKLPSNKMFQNPTLSFQADHQYLEAYMEGMPIYKFGTLDPKNKVKSYSYVWHNIRLVPNFQGKFLYLRIYSSSNSYLGILKDVNLGNFENFITNTLKEHSDQLILSFFFTFVGLISLLFFFLLRMKEKALFWLSVFSLSLGVNNFCAIQINHLLTIIPPTLWFYLSTISNFSIPMGLCAFIEYSFDTGSGLIYRRLWQGYLLCGILGFVLDATNLVSLLHSSDLFSLIALLTIPIILYGFLKAYRKDDIDRIISTLGIVTICLSGFYDIIGGSFHLIPWSHPIYPLGMTIFITALIIITSRRYIGVHDKLKIYSEEIEIQNAAINEANIVLETTNEELLSLLAQVQNTQAQLIQSEKMAALGGLVAGVAHEINTPLGISITATSFLQQQLKEFCDLYSSGKMKKLDLENYISSLKEASIMIMSNMQRTADFVKSFKQVAVDQSSEEKREFNIKLYIEEVLLSLKPKLKKTQHTVTVNCADNIIIYNCPGALSQVITNLIMNSLIHAYGENDKGNIIIDVTVKGKYLYLKYSDDGKGIDNEIIHKIFDPFFTTKRGQGGTGLGLNIVYNIVNKTLSGSIVCESELGKGTTFIIEFPLDDKSESGDGSLTHLTYF